MSIFTAEPNILANGYDIPSDSARVFTAAKHLVDFRDGLAGVLLDLAEITADQDCDTAARRIARACAALGPDEAYRRGVRITTIAGGVWGIFPEIGAAKENTLATLRAVCRDTATAVRDELHRDSCICRDATKETHR